MGSDKVSSQPPIEVMHSPAENISRSIQSPWYALHVFTQMAGFLMGNRKIIQTVFMSSGKTIGDKDHPDFEKHPNVNLLSAILLVMILSVFKPPMVSHLKVR